jgi:hypothetical protein
MAYMKVNEGQFEMAGVGAPRDTLFGLIGATKGAVESTKTLGGLVADTKASAGIPSGLKETGGKDPTEHKIAGRKNATKISGAHFGQVPYAGRYMADKGQKL